MKPAQIVARVGVLVMVAGMGTCVGGFGYQPGVALFVLGTIATVGGYILGAV